MLKKLRESVLSDLKNIYGWKTNRKMLIFSVDDYGNVRVDSRQARDRMVSAGLKLTNRFDAYDALETREDLEILFETLTSVKDINGNHAIFTPFALPCNIDFERMAGDGYREFYYELLPDTFTKLADMNPKAYAGAWNLWLEGINKGILVPQFHGREHFNLKVFEDKLAAKDHEVLTALKNRSYSSISKSAYPTINVMAAFDFWEFSENFRFESIIKEGLDAFEKVFGYPAIHFTPPAGRENPAIHKYLMDGGIRFIDTPLIKKEHRGKGKYKIVLNYTGKKNKMGHTFIVRNVVFEPTDYRGFDWIDKTLMQIKTAFYWRRPAVISSHRVNYCGHIDIKNRELGIKSLQTLLKKVIKKWPDVEFMSTSELCKLISKNPFK